ncbi:MAG: hypothetical protein ACOY3I_10535 [Verrucomicrobiota bacterium]
MNLLIENLDHSVRQILLAARYGETEDILWWPLIGLLSTVERKCGLERLSFREKFKIEDTVFDLISNHTFADGEILVRHEHLWEEEYARLCDSNGEMLLDNNQWLISQLVWYVARKKKKFKRIKVIFCVYSLHALVLKKIVYYPAPMLSKFEKFIHKKLSLIQKYLNVPDDQLPLCTKEDGISCIDCMVAKHCPKKGSL